MSPSPTASYDRPRVGGDILCLCTRCKMELAHVVVAMVDGRPKRVVCKTCKSEHSFRANSHRSESARSTRPYRPVQKTSMLASQMWEKLLNESGNRPPVPYSPTAVFSKGDCLSHPKFGLGCVEEVRLSNKILVFFKDGEKVLVHGLSKSDA